MKCKCRDCGRVIDQDAGEEVCIVNPCVADESFDLCSDCLEQQGDSIVSCEGCTERIERRLLTARLVPSGFVECPYCNRDVFSGRTLKEYAKATCSECGRPIRDPYEERVINFGLPEARKICNSCFGSMWDAGTITKCESCGEWYEPRLLHGAEDIDDFMPCPSCGKDVCEGYTREEAAQLMNERKEVGSIDKLYTENATLRWRLFQLKSQISGSTSVNEATYLVAENEKLRRACASCEALLEELRELDCLSDESTTVANAPELVEEEKRGTEPAKANTAVNYVYIDNGGNVQTMTELKSRLYSQLNRSAGDPLSKSEQVRPCVVPAFF